MLLRSLLTLSVCLTAAAAPAAAAPASKSPAKSPAKKLSDHVVPWGRLAATTSKAEYLLDKPDVVIGSDAKADVVIQASTVSARHCKLTIRAGHVQIEDLGSRYGTLVAGTALQKGKPMAIEQPVEIALGAETLRFEFGQRPALLLPLGLDRAKPGPKTAKPHAAAAPVAPPQRPAKQVPAASTNDKATH